MEERKMKSIYKVYNDCLKICFDLNIPVANTIHVKVNTRAKKRWGFVLLNVKVNILLKFRIDFLLMKFLKKLHLIL